MFKFALSGQVRWPVKFPQRDPSGEIKYKSVVCTFQMLTRDELIEIDQEALQNVTAKLTKLLKQGDQAGLNFDEALASYTRTERESYERVVERVLGWDETALKAVDENGEDVDFPFCPENLKVILRDHGIFKAVREALLEASRGAVEKN